MDSLFDVPFLPDENYVSFLNENAEHIDSVHFSILHNRRLDNRIQLELLNSQDQVISQLVRLSGPRKYALMNSRFYAPAFLTDDTNVWAIIKVLEQCLEWGVLSGIVYCDHYLLQRLSDVSPEVTRQLEAVPGINTMLDSTSKVEAQLSYIGATNFKQPAKIILDRSLNRNLDLLADIALKIHRQYPDLRIEALANEGCLPYCPFKLSHDSYIALANVEGVDSTHKMNCEMGCIRMLEGHPHRILQSPFIRPEDIDLYFYHVDTIKLCGRTLGPGFLTRIFTAYRDRQYDGNLLDLLDAMQWMSKKLYVDNSALSFDFANMLSMCDHRCASCGFCKELFESISHRLPITIKDNRVAAE